MTKSVVARMNFVDAPEGVGRVSRVYEPDGTSHHPLRAYEVEIANARALEEAPSLDREGFALIKHATQLKDFRDDEELTRVYLPEMRAL
ncbi:MAG TPA: hypothetical protein VEH07_07340, partial [Alphaproteobacteria bacterium]|nr:hypothetical protein [Alphaproteobacteria bacterium]